MEGVIFDLDGSLIDSMYIWDSLAYEYLKSIGYKVSPGVYRELRDMDLEDSSAYLVEKYKLPLLAQELERGMSSMLEHYYQKIFELKPGALEFLRGLKNKGIKLCIGTTCQEDLVWPLLERLGLEAYFEFILTEDRLGVRKTEPAFYDLVWERLSTDKEKTWVFEDALYAIESAKKAGFKVVAVRDESSLDQEEEIEARADLYIDDFKEMEVGLLWKNF